MTEGRMDMKIAGLDIGTTGCKCTVFDKTGQQCARAYKDYPVKRNISGHEIDVSVIMDAVYEVLGKVAALCPDIAGIGVTSFGETCVLTDETGTPLHAAMLYTDPRGAEQCRRLEEMLGEGDREKGARKIAGIAGVRPHEMYSLPKAMWLKENRPEIFEKASYLFLMEDYVVFHLTGVRQIDYSLACRAMALDIEKLTWSRELLENAGIREEMLSVPVPSGTVAGCITAAVAQKTGLSGSVHIVSIGHDQVAAAVGAGIFDSAVAADGAGTVECITPVFDGLPDMDVMYQGYFAVVPYVVPGKYAAYAFSYTGGALLQWCVDTLAKLEKQDAIAQGLSVNESLEKAYRKKRGEEPSGLLILPHFAGAATPYMDTGSRGAVLGLTTDTGVPELYRACMESVVYEMAVNTKALGGSGSCFTGLRATGGGARSKEWLQMKADVMNLSVTALACADAGTVGSAMLTGVAIGFFVNLQEAAQCLIEERETYYPRPEMHEKYQKELERYFRLYQAVRPFFGV